MGKIDLRQMEQFVDRIVFLGVAFLPEGFEEKMNSLFKSKGFDLTPVKFTFDVEDWGLSVKRYAFFAKADRISVKIMRTFNAHADVDLYVRLTNDRTGLVFADHIALDGSDMDKKIVALFGKCLE
jgi:hypothetical protein